MDTIMAAQEHVALARSLFDLYNNRQSDPAWLDKVMAAFAADCEIIDVPSGAILRGLDGYKRIVLFFAESLPASRVELTNAFATEDQVVLEGTSRWTNTGPLQLPSGALPARFFCSVRNAVGNSCRVLFTCSTCAFLEHTDGGRSFFRQQKLIA